MYGGFVPHFSEWGMTVPQLVAYVTCSLTASSLLHQRCACHIINLIVKCGLKLSGSSTSGTMDHWL
jgi:hypothetical protein